MSGDDVAESFQHSETNDYHELHNEVSSQTYYQVNDWHSFDSLSNDEHLKDQ